MKRKILATTLVAAMTITSLVGCGSSETASTTSAATTAAAATTQSSGGEAKTESAEPAEFSYPMEAADPMTYWVCQQVMITPNFSNFGDTPLAAELSRVTGIDMEYLQPPIGQETEQFSLLLADGNLPDIIEYNWLNTYPGGPQKAIDDGVIIPLNDVFEQYCPNIMAYLEANPDIDRMIKTDDGTYYCFPFVRGDLGLCYTTGPMLRSDWLEEVGMDIPETMDDWHEVLTAFKDEMGSTAPLTFQSDAGFWDMFSFGYAYNLQRGLFIGDDGTVHYGASEASYKDFLTTMAQWYAEGLIDQDMATANFEQVSSKMTSGVSGASFGFAGSRMGAWLTTAQPTNPEYDLVPTPFPTVEEGATREYGYVDQLYKGVASGAITTSCTDIERAARFLDYGYSEEGHILYNFGVEGVSFEWIDGYPTYTDLIMNNPDGWPVSQAMAAHIRGNYNGPFVQDLRYVEQYYTSQGQIDSIEVWGDSNGAAHIMPPLTPTSEENSEYATIMNEVNTYRDEMTLKYILGTESLDTFDQYIANLEKMGLSRALEIQNAALDRYNAR